MTQTDTPTPQPQFGANSWLVDEMYRDYLADPDAVGESWREFFSDYTPAWTNPAPQARTAPDGGARPAPAKPAPATPRPAPPATPAPAGTSGASAAGAAAPQDELTPLRGVSATIAANMLTSLEVPTATSIREIPAKLLEVNRRIINNQLIRTRGGKVSFTHLIGWAVVQAIQALPVMRSSYAETGGKPQVRRPAQLNLGLAVDKTKPDGTHTLLVPNIRGADSLDFGGFFRAYEELIRRVRTNDLDGDMFADTTVTLTNPGTVGTVGSVPRLMSGQSAIVGVGAIDFPAEYQGADPRRLADIGVGKVITVTSTYDHRVIQGAESGLFLAYLHQLLLGQHDFYDGVFNSLHMPYEPVRWHRDENPSSDTRLATGQKQMAVAKVIRAYRVRGHLIANLNPLAHKFTPVHAELDPANYGLSIWDLDREFVTGSLAGQDLMTLGDILGLLRDAYCRTVGVEYMHIQAPDEKNWIQAQVEGTTTTLNGDEQRLILQRLNAAEAFERFLHTKYIGHKRFSLEGAESTIAALGGLLDHAADYGITEAVIGMAHRGRLNVLANVLGKSYDKIFREFEGDVDPESVQGSGDVKYHLGTKGVHQASDNREIQLHLSANPSHLEAVNPVVEGMVRARLDQLGHPPGDPVLPILLHGDAAFAGQGVVPETLTMSQLRGYQTGGTIHLIVNNQLGFTTGPQQARSSQYATDVAKGVQAPILHVNGDDPEACVRVMRLALDYRQKFRKDVVVDLVCYRRWGHNEGDDPSYTQPIMYAAIEQRRSVRKLYTEELVNRGDLTLEQAEQALDDFRARLEGTLAETRESIQPDAEITLRPVHEATVRPHVDTGVKQATLQRIVDAVTSAPEGFQVHPKLGKQLERRRDLLRKDVVDWAMGEALAFGSLVLEGTPVRVAGQDSRRGTFSQRHSVLIDHQTEAEHTPLANLDPDQARFAIYDSLLSEYAALGFEYGYSVVREDALVAWEAQFGDFGNGAQIIIDQFIVAAEDKWRQRSGVVMLLPHGYEGQGPEHSSARIERFLTLCADDNIQVTQPTTPAQYFHLLRRQVRIDPRKPLIVFTPKGLLRSKAARSPASTFTQGSFAELLGDPGAPNANTVKRVLLCSGRVAYDLLDRRDALSAPVAILRVEQLYPFPQDQIVAALEIDYPSATEVGWVQDEPENMGAWPYVHQRLHRALRDSHRLFHKARPEAASPASGSATIHAAQQQALLNAAFADL